jgi:hypothetical protein
VSAIRDGRMAPMTVRRREALSANPDLSTLRRVR